MPVAQVAAVGQAPPGDEALPVAEAQPPAVGLRVATVLRDQEAVHPAAAVGRAWGDERGHLQAAQAYRDAAHSAASQGATDEAGLQDHPLQRELQDVAACQAVVRQEEQELPADAALQGAAFPDEPAWLPGACQAATRVGEAVPAAWAAGLREVNLRVERRPEAASQVAYPDVAGACPPAVVQEQLLGVPDGAVEAERQRVRQLPELELV